MSKRKTSSRARRSKKKSPTGWTPFKETPSILLELVPQDARKPEKLYQNSRFWVFWFTTLFPGGHTLVELAIRNKDQSAKHDWREFHRIKNELLGREEEAVELYPAESRLTDTKNEFHLWCIRGLRFSFFGWNEREISEASERQRPWPEGEKPADLPGQGEGLPRKEIVPEMSPNETKTGKNSRMETNGNKG
jgi:hypothetical protein